MGFTDSYMKQLDVWEGDVTHAYLDTAKPANVTVGRGYLIGSLVAMLELPWRDAFESVATQSQIVTEWNRLRAMPPGKAAKFYFSPNGLTLRQPDIDALTFRVINACIADLRVDFPGFAAFPDSAKLGLLDMRYNLGNARLKGTYPNLDACVNRRDWKGAAKECGRNTADEAFASRNEWTKAQFLNAANGW